MLNPISKAANRISIECDINRDFVEGWCALAAKDLAQGLAKLREMGTKGLAIELTDELKKKLLSEIIDNSTCWVMVGKAANISAAKIKVLYTTGVPILLDTLTEALVAAQSPEVRSKLAEAEALIRAGKEAQERAAKARGTTFAFKES